MINAIKKLFMIISTTIAALTFVLCALLLDSDFQNKLIVPILVSLAWLAIVAYANKEKLGEEQWER